VGNSNARAADYEDCKEQQITAERPGYKCRRDQQRGGCVDAVRGTYDQSAVVSVCHMTDQKGQHDRRDELNEADKPEVKGAVGKLVDLPTDGDG